MRYFSIIFVLCLTLSMVQAQQTSFVNPFIGTSDDHGQTDPSATIPFGMIKPGPETIPRGNGGYDYQSQQLKGFSQTRMSGVGCIGVGGNLLITPFVGTACKTLKMDKASETAIPGYYSVTLDNQLKVEITTGRTAAIYRFTYPATETAGIKINFKHSYGKHIAEEHSIIGDNAVKGFVRSACTCDLGSYKFYYYIEKDKSTYKPEDNDSELLWKFQTEPNEQIILKIGLSSVSAEEAEANLKKECSNQSFEQIRTNARIAWENLLGQIQVETSDEDLKTSFDIIGDIVIVEIPENLEEKKSKIGKATLEFTKRKSVYMKKSAIHGTIRIRDLELIAGENDPITIHKEHGTRLKLNVEEVYFSPRLATERKRVSDSVKENENILDMQGITEAVSRYFYSNGDSFDGLFVAPEHQDRFERLASDAIEYYEN